MNTKTKNLVLATTAALLASGAVQAQKDPSQDIQPVQRIAPELLVEITGEGVTDCVSAGGTNCTGDIPEFGGGPLVSTFDVSGCGAVNNVKVGLDVTHTWVGDLAFTVTSPGGTPVTVFDRPGVPDSTFGCSGNDIQAFLDDAAGTPVEDECAVTEPTIDGVFIPNNPLASLVGELGDGTWTLEVEDLAGADTGNMNNWSLDLDCFGQPQEGDALFFVSKQFADGNNESVTVQMQCDSGNPTQQEVTLVPNNNFVAGFVLSNIPDDTNVTCTIREVAVSGAYVTDYTMSGPSGEGISETECTFEGPLQDEVNSCRIVNSPKPVEVTVSKEWIYPRDGGEDVEENVEITLQCDAPISGAPEIEGTWTSSQWIEGTNEAVFLVTPNSWDPANSCRAWENINDSRVEQMIDGCDSLTVRAGSGDSCTITNTVFFEGIPTLSQWGMAIMALLMLGIGFVSVRRFA
jgi:subtilisin-like proprotein convertase family protein